MLTAGPNAFNELDKAEWVSLSSDDEGLIERADVGGERWLRIGFRGTSRADLYADGDTVYRKLNTSASVRDGVHLWSVRGLQSDTHHLLKLGHLSCLGELLNTWGAPPEVILSDWREQLARSGAASRLDDLSKPESWLQLNRLLVATDGRIFDVFELMKTSSEGGSLTSSLLSNANSSLQRSGLERSLKANPKIAEAPIRRATTKQPLRNQRMLFIGSGAVLATILVGCGIWLLFPEGSEVAQVPNPKIVDQRDEKILPRDEPTTFDVNASSNESDEPLGLSTVQELGEASSDLEAEATASLESLLSSLGKDAKSDEPNGEIFASVQKLFEERDDKKIVEESLPVAGSEFSSSSSTATPFAEPLEADAPEVMSDSGIIISGTSTAEPTDSESENGAEAKALNSQKWTFAKSLDKRLIKVPFRPSDKSAVCRVRLVAPPELQMLPEGPVLLGGKQDAKWRVAFEDEAVSLNVYLRSKPARSWYIATAVCASIDGDRQFPVTTNDAQLVCKRLQLHLKWLDQQRVMIDKAKQNSRLRSSAYDAIREVDKQIKQTEQSLSSWQEVSKLVSLFFSSCSFELDFAVESDALPILATPPEPAPEQ